MFEAPLKPYMPIIHTLAVYCISTFEYLKKYRIFILAFLITLLFYLRALSHHSHDAGLLYTGDVLGYYLPLLMKTHSLLWKHNFSAIDYSLFNGSSDFFLSPNSFAFHPLVLLYSLLVPFKKVTMHSSGHFLVLLLAFHSFIACYFSLKLFTRYFSFDLGMALLTAVGFAFNWHMVSTLTQPPFLFCASIIPWVIYSSLRYVESPSFGLLIQACLPIIFALLGGYMPMGLACLAMSAVLIVAKLLFIDAVRGYSRERLVSLVLLASLPFLLVLVITSPYLYAIFKFHTQTPAAQVPGLFYSAYQLAEAPQTIARLISVQFKVPGPLYEFSVYWGIIALAIFAIFFFSSKTFNALTERDWRVFKVVAIMYFATVLAIYGEHSVVSSWVFYLVPQIGKMHIYQRFLLPSQLLLMIMLALMLKALVESRPPIASRFALLFLALITFGAAILLAYNPNFAKILALNNYLLFELILGCLFAGLLLIPGEKFAYYGAIVLFCLPTFNQMYDFSQGGHTLAAQRIRQPMALDQEEKARFLAYLRRFSNKQIIKYIDLTPMWTQSGIETFPKDFPYLVLKEVNLSSYGGFTFYLSPLAEYMQRMPVGADIAVKPDWQWLKDTGADFAIAMDTDDTNKLLAGFINKNKSEDLYKLPNNVLVVPLQFKKLSDNSSTIPAIYDNGYFRVYPASALPTIATAFKSKHFHSNNANYVRFEFEAASPTYVQYLFWNNLRLHYYLNGKKVRPIKHNGLTTIIAPAGKNTLEIRYRYWPLRVFGLFYGLFIICLLSTLIPASFRLTLKSKMQGYKRKQITASNPKNRLGKSNES